MREVSQKSANSSDREQVLLESGLLEPAIFDKYFTVRAYEPAEALAPYVSHYWVMRWQLPKGVIYRPAEVLSAPMMHVFFTKDKAFVYGIVDGMLKYETAGIGTIAGITFKPGGMRLFWRGKMAELCGVRTDLTTLFPIADSSYSAQLITQSDDKIVTEMESLLQSVPLGPPISQLQLVQKVIDVIRTNSSPVTVASIAKDFKTSERTLQHLFKTYIGVGIKWVLMRERLLKAIGNTASVPGATHLSWAQLASDMGYSSQTHFVNDFKRVVGKTPQVYLRERNKDSLSS